MLRNAVLVIVLSFFSGIHFAVAANNNEPAKTFSEAQRLTAAGEITQAIKLYKSIIFANPQLPEAYNNLAALYLKQKNSKQAKDILEKGLQAHKGYGALYNSLTAINVAMARDAYSKALQIDLKPADVTITSLTLNENQQDRIQRTIVISKNKPEVKNNTPLPVKKNESVVTTQKQVKLNNTNPIEKTLQAWSVAWSAQAVDMYLSFYHNQYKPSNGLSRKGWLQSRRFRLKKPRWIKVVLSDFELKQKTDKQAVVNFKQSYQSNSFSDISNKQMVLLYTDNGWQIFREKSL